MIKSESFVPVFLKLIKSKMKTRPIRLRKIEKRIGLGIALKVWENVKIAICSLMIIKMSKENNSTNVIFSSSIEGLKIENNKFILYFVVLLFGDFISKTITAETIVSNPQTKNNLLLKKINNEKNGIIDNIFWFTFLYSIEHNPVRAIEDATNSKPITKSGMLDDWIKEMQKIIPQAIYPMENAMFGNLKWIWEIKKEQKNEIIPINKISIGHSFSDILFKSK